MNEFYAVLLTILYVMVLLCIRARYFRVGASCFYWLSLFCLLSVNNYKFVILNAINVPWAALIPTIIVIITLSLIKEFKNGI